MDGTKKNDLIEKAPFPEPLIFLVTEYTKITLKPFIFITREWP